MGGGGDGGYSEQQAKTEAQKQKARDALNLIFGVEPTGGTAPARSDFTTGAYSRFIGDGQSETSPGVFDQAGYDKALTDWNGRGSEAAKNKAARDALYGTIRQNAFDTGKRGFDENKDKAARDLKFTLFAQGLNGGSVDVDQNALLGRTYDKGLLDLGAKADAAKTDFANSDEQTRLGLLQSIDAGMDQGSALSSALNQAKINSDRAAASAQGTSVGDLFADAGLLYTKSNAARGRADALYDPRLMGFRTPQTRSYSGIITPTGG